MRSCALRIFEAETISSARVTLRVFATLLILVRISRAPAMPQSIIGWALAHRHFRRSGGPRPTLWGSALPGTGLLEFLDALLESGLDVVVPVGGVVDLLHQIAVVVLEVRVQRRFERQDLRDRQI